MKISNLLLASSIAVLAACNSESNTEEVETTTTETEVTQEEEAAPDYLSVPEGASVHFANIENGATVSSPVHVEMAVEGMTVKPAGEMEVGTGHHHIIINKGHISKGDIVPSDEMNIHYGAGQTETDLELEPGTYTLTMQFANGAHQSYGEQMSATVEIVVE